jgi:hypothetical protein
MAGWTDLVLFGGLALGGYLVITQGAGAIKNFFDTITGTAEAAANAPGTVVLGANEAGVNALAPALNALGLNSVVQNPQKSLLPAETGVGLTLAGINPVTTSVILGGLNKTLNVAYPSPSSTPNPAPTAATLSLFSANPPSTQQFIASTFKIPVSSVNPAVNIGAGGSMAASQSNYIIIGGTRRAV